MGKQIAKREVGLGLNISEFAKGAKTAEELLDKITQGRTISLDAKLNLGDAQAVLQKILDQKTVSIRTALDVKDLMSIMEKSIADFEQRGSTSLARMNRRFLEEFQTDLGSVNFKLDDGTLIGGYQKAIEQANKLNLLNEKQGQITDQVATKTRDQTAAIKQESKATDELNKSVEKQLKLNKMKNDSGKIVPQTYTAVNGQYEIQKGTEGWNLYETDTKGQLKFITAYKTLNELKRDSTLIAEQEAIAQNKLTKTIDTVTTKTEKKTRARQEDAKITVRTIEQVNAELEQEKQKLQEINSEIERNDNAFQALYAKKENYGKVVFDTDVAVYDTEILSLAAKELKEFNDLLATRNKFQEKYIKLRDIISRYYVGERMEDYTIDRGIYKNMDQYISQNPNMKRLNSFFQNGQKTTNKEINELFRNIVRELQSDGATVGRLLSSGEVYGAQIRRELNSEETNLNQTNQRLLAEREAQLTKINALRQEELDLTTKAGQEEIKNTQIAKTKSRYYEIDEKAAKLSKQMRSFDDYKAGSATASYRSAIDEIAKIVEEKKAQFPDQSDKLDELFDRFARNLANFINRDNQIGAQYPSVMISGAGNYNTKKHNRQMASWGKNYQYYDEKVLPIESRIRNFGSTGTIAIRNDESDALEKREAKLEYMKYWHEIMVEVNKYYRKNKTLEGFEGVGPDELERIKKDFATIKQVGMYDVPYPQYALRNDNQNIKRIEGSVAELKRLKENKGLQENNDIYKLWTDKQDMRIRISFEIGKPDQEIIDMLKGKSFKWSPKNNAWQRQLTDNAVYDTKRLQEALHEFYGITSVPDVQGNISAMEKL